MSEEKILAKEEQNMIEYIRRLDEIEVQIAGTFAKDKFIVIKNKSKNPFENALPHPFFDYEKKKWLKDGREEYMKEWTKQKEQKKDIAKE